MAKTGKVDLVAMLTIFTMFKTNATVNKAAKYQLFATNEDNFEESASYNGFGWVVYYYERIPNVI